MLKDHEWWRNAVFYQIYPRSFRDLNGDGEGDLPGVISELPYLSSLGIDALWLSPFYRSPNNDGGYDISDPRDVDPRFGTLEDAKTLIRTAHEHGLKVIFDIVPNHFSSDHQWFQEAIQAAPGSNARQRFHFRDGRGESGELPPNNWISLFNGSAWTRITEADGQLGQWYLHLFDSSQPDLNWENPEVRKDFETTIRFWLDLGLDGFRIDVAQGLIKSDLDRDHPDPQRLVQALRIDAVDMEKSEREKLLSDIPFFDRDGVHAIYRDWRKIFDSYDGDRMTVGEVFVYPSARIARYVRQGELSQVFNFDFLLIDWDASIIREAIERIIRELGEVKAPPTWALNNHDSPRVATRLKSLDKAKALAMIAHALPGAVYIYQGEELGLIDGTIPPEARQDPIFIRSNGADLGRDGCRVPLPWRAHEVNFGFGSGTSWLPQSENFRDYSVDSQERDASSTLHFYRKMLALRKTFTALARAEEIHWQDSEPHILHFIRKPDFELVSNTSMSPSSVHVLGKSILLASSPEAILSGGLLTLPGNSTAWLQI